MKDIEKIFAEYVADENALLKKIDFDALKMAVRLIRDVYDTDKTVFIAGNGGSAATANHFACDFGKNAIKKSNRKIRIISLCGNLESITAYGNDIAFERIFSEQLKNLMRPGDILILLSASGESPDIIEAAEYSRKINNKIIGLSGMGGGRLALLSDINLTVTSTSYEKIEDVHLAMLHMITRAFIDMDL